MQSLVEVLHTDPQERVSPHINTLSLQVVTKLFNIVEPDMAFFGKKDYQQWRILEVGRGICGRVGLLFSVLAVL